MNPFDILKNITNIAETANNILNCYFEALDYFGFRLESSSEFEFLDYEQINQILEYNIKLLGVR